MQRVHSTLRGAMEKILGVQIVVLGPYNGGLGALHKLLGVGVHASVTPFIAMYTLQLRGTRTNTPTPFLRIGIRTFPLDISPRTFASPGQFLLFTGCRTFPSFPPPPFADLQYKAIYRNEAIVESRITARNSARRTHRQLQHALLPMSNGSA